MLTLCPNAYYSKIRVGMGRPIWVDVRPAMTTMVVATTFMATWYQMMASWRSQYISMK